MSERKNRRVLLKARPQGASRESDFALEEVPVAPLTEGQFLIRNLYL